MGKLKRMDEIQQILRTCLELGSYKATARRLKVSKNTVKHYVGLANLTGKDLKTLIHLEQAAFIKLTPLPGYSDRHPLLRVQKSL